MTPARPPSLQEHVVDWLRQAIVAGDLRPGQRVGQEEVAERTGVSVVPVREALRVLEQEGQLTHLPRRGYFVTELRLDDLEEIYALRQVLEERAVRHALPTVDADAVARMERFARECEAAADRGEVSAELAANRRFHFELMEAPGQPHLLRMIRVLWDSTEAYRALYYNAPAERDASAQAHARILDAVRARDADRLVDELDAHRGRALEVLERVLGQPATNGMASSSQERGGGGP